MDTWWVWLLLGLFLLLAEALTPGGFFLLFFGLGAILVGALAGFGAGGPLWTQVLVFTVASVVGLLAFRPPLMRRFQVTAPGRPVDSLVRETAVVTEEIGPHGFGRVELRGTPWSAKNLDEATLRQGQRCRVEHVDGLTLWVRGQ